jgi:hypothetical protein
MMRSLEICGKHFIINFPESMERLYTGNNHLLYKYKPHNTVPKDSENFVTIITKALGACFQSSLHCIYIFLNKIWINFVFLCYLF